MATKKIRAGVQAPEFTLESFNLGKADLKELYEKNNTIIIFSRYFGCSLCQYELDLILSKFPYIQKNGTNLLYITQSGESTARKFIQDKNIPFPVIPSSRDELYLTYGLKMFTLTALTKIPKLMAKAKAGGYEHGEYVGWENQCPGQVVVDTQGKITYYHKGWLNLDELFNFIRS